MNPILVAGTGSWKHDGSVDWFEPGHDFGKFLTAQGCAPTYDGAQPFVWSTNLSGVPWLTRSKFVDWSAGGAALDYFVREALGFESAKTAIVAHSHGLQVVLFACAEHGLKVKTLISVGSPIRKDMSSIASKARQNIGYWIHIHSDETDRWQWLGELFSGNWRVVREAPLANRNDFVPGVGHSELLRDQAQFHFWLDRGWIGFLK